MKEILSVQEMVRVEAEVCKALRWELIIPNALDFTNLLCEDILDDAEKKKAVRQIAVEELRNYYTRKQKKLKCKNSLCFIWVFTYLFSFLF